ncbi:hypothetical protein I352_04481 [Cryptococcus deuterogattii MMRL2647]|nr:hypothetical protein I352_04481 [Cryptococcus deuterogattii MMRL2647]
MPPTPSTDDLTPQSAHLLLASLRNLRTSLTHTLDRLDATILRVDARAALSTLPPQAALGNPSHAPETAPHISGNGPGEQPVETRLQTDPWVLRAQTVENRIMRLRQTARELRERAEANDGRALPAPLGQEPAGRVVESANNDANGSQSISAFIDSIRQDQAQVENGMRRLDALSTYLISQRPNSSSSEANNINVSSRPTNNVIRPSTPRPYNHPRGLAPTNNLYAYPHPERVGSNIVSGHRASSTASTIRASDQDYFESGGARPNTGSRTYSPPLRIVSNVQRESGAVDNQSLETLGWSGNSPSIRSVATLSRNAGNREFDFRSLFDFPLESPIPFVGVSSSNIRTRDVNNGGNAAEDSLTRRGRTVHQRMNNSQPQPQPQPQLAQPGIIPDIRELRRFNEVNEQPSFFRPMTERFSLSPLEATALRRLGSQERPSSAELQMVPFRSVSDGVDPSRHGNARPDTGTTQSPGLNSTSLPFDQTTLPPRTTQIRDDRDDTTFEERMERIRNARASLRQVSQLRRDMRTVRRGPPPAPGMGMAEPPVAPVDSTGSREIQAPLTRDSDVNQDPRRRNSTTNSSPHTRLTPGDNNRLQLDPTDPTDPWNNDTSFQGAMETLHNALAGELERRHWVIQSEAVDDNDGERRRDQDLVDDGIGLDILVLEVGVTEQRPTPAQNVAVADVGSTPAGDAMVRSEGERGEELLEDNADEDQEDQDEEQVSRERRDIGLSSRRISMKECYQVDLHLWPGMTGWGNKRKEGTSCREVTIEPLQFTV